VRVTTCLNKPYHGKVGCAAAATYFGYCVPSAEFVMHALVCFASGEGLERFWRGAGMHAVI